MFVDMFHEPWKTGKDLRTVKSYHKVYAVHLWFVRTLLHRQESFVPVTLALQLYENPRKTKTTFHESLHSKVLCWEMLV